MTTNTNTSDAAVVLDTPDGIAFAQLLSFRGRLKIEMATGLRSSTPTLKNFNRTYGLNLRRKEDALATAENIVRMIKEEDHILWPDGTGRVGLYERAELFAELQAKGVLVPVEDA